ncbi:MAG TPA: hypothetical protein PLG47_04260 [Candidatus Dojkabacteria bacterium]|nr:hypothetical protein [Candidatus Dojkabacteria bacterium]
MLRDNTYYWVKYDANSLWEIVKVKQGMFKFFDGGELLPNNVYKFIELNSTKPQNLDDDLIKNSI